MPLAVRAHQDGELRALVAGVGDRAHDADRLGRAVRAVAQGDERHLAVVIDLREGREELVREAIRRPEEAELQIFLGDALEEGAMQRLVLGPDRAERQGFTGREREARDQFARIRSYREAHGRIRRDGRAGVESEHAALVAEQGIDVELDEPRLIDDELRQPEQGVDERVEGDGRPVAIAAQQTRDARALDELARERGIQRRQRDGGIAQDFDRGAARAEHQRRPEHGIAGQAEQELVGAAERRHALHGVAAVMRLGPVSPEILVDAGEGGVQRGGIGQIELHAADVGFVRDVRRDELRRDGITKTRRRCQRFRARRDAHGLDDRHAIGGEQGLGLELAEAGAARGEGGVDHGAHTGRVGRAEWPARRRFDQTGLVARVVHELQPRAHGGGRRIELRNAGRGEDLAAGGDGRAAHPHREQGASRRQREVGDAARDRGVVDDRGRHQHHEQRVPGRAAPDDLERARIARRVRVADDVQRVRARPGARQARVERGDELGFERGERAAGAGQRIGREHAEAAAVGDDQQALARGARARMAQGFDRLEELVDAVHTQQAGASHGGVEDVVTARDRTSVRRRGLRAGGVAAGLDQHDGLVTGDGTRRRQELTRRHHGFDVEQDRARVVLMAEVVDQIAEVDVERVAQRNEMREADAARIGPVEHRRAQRARLRHEGERARPAGSMREARIELRAGREQAYAIRPQDAQLIASRGIETALTDVGRDGRFALEGGDDDRRARAAGAERFDQIRQGRRRRAQHGEIRRGGEHGDRRHAAHALDAVVTRIDRPDRPLETRRDEIPEHDVADAVGSGRRPDHGDRGRTAESFEMDDAHWQLH